MGFGESLTIYRELRFKTGIAASLSNLAQVEEEIRAITSQPDSLAEQSLAIYRELEDQPRIAVGACHLTFRGR